MNKTNKNKKKNMSDDDVIHTIDKFFTSFLLLTTIITEDYTNNVFCLIFLLLYLLSRFKYIFRNNQSRFSEKPSY